MFSLSFPVKVFATRGSANLAEEVCRHLQRRLPRQTQAEGGIRLGRSIVTDFSNENLQVQLGENVRGHFVVVVHTQAPPVSQDLVELLALLDAIEGASPADRLLVFAYMPYVRSDRKNKPRISTMGKRLADILSRAFSLRRILLLDPHDSHVKHYFRPAADEITANYLLVDHLQRNLIDPNPDKKFKIVFADHGAADRFHSVPHLLRLPTAYIDKDRPDDTETPELKKIVGDVAGYSCILWDDELVTGLTFISGATNLLSEGHAEEVYGVFIHPVLADKKKSVAEVMRVLQDCPVKHFYMTSSIPVRHKITPADTKFTIIPVEPLLAEAITRIVQNDSLSLLHQIENVQLYRE